MDDSMERRTWLDKLVGFMDERRTPITSCPTISKNPLDLFRLYLYVKDRGGFMEVCKVQCSSIQPSVSYIVSVLFLCIFAFPYTCSTRKTVHFLRCLAYQSLGNISTGSFEVLEGVLFKICIEHAINFVFVSIRIEIEESKFQIKQFAIETPQNTLCFFTSMLNCA